MSYDERMENLGLSHLTTRRVRSDLIQTFKIINGIDKVEKTLFFEIEVGLEEDIQINYSKNVADLILGNMLLVIALLTNGNL